MILSSPVYTYGLFIAQKPDACDLLPPIVFNSVYLMLTPQFFKPYSIIHRLSDRTGVIIGVLITGAGITFNGFLLSSSHSYYLIGTIFYGGLGGNLRLEHLLIITTVLFATNQSHSGS